MKGPLFYSKILLFGEYGIIEDSKGLSIPYNFFNGALKIAEKPNLESEKSNNTLADFCSYLKQLDELDLDLISFEKHISKGLYFDSSIPKGYGVGSSGALVAAVYDKYSNNKITVLENLTREKCDKEIEEFKMNIATDSINAYSIRKIKPNISSEFLSNCSKEVQSTWVNLYFYNYN